MPRFQMLLWRLFSEENRISEQIFPYLAKTRPSGPYPTPPVLTTPDLTRPYLGELRPTFPYHSRPRQGQPNLTRPNHTWSCQTPPSPTLPCPGGPLPTTPNQSIAHRARPIPAEPDQAYSRFYSGDCPPKRTGFQRIFPCPTNPKRTVPKPPFPYQARADLSDPRPTRPHPDFTLETVLRREQDSKESFHAPNHQSSPLQALPQHVIPDHTTNKSPNS